MKTTHSAPKLTALAMTLALGFAASAMADGITAPPKTLEFLNYLNRNQTVFTVPVEAQTMKCGMCRNEITTRTDYTARGANKPVIMVATHACIMCDTQLKIVGVGKAANTVAVHACTDGCSLAMSN